MIKIGDLPNGYTFEEVTCYHTILTMTYKLDYETTNYDWYLYTNKIMYSITLSLMMTCSLNQSLRCILYLIVNLSTPECAITHFPLAQ